MAVYGNVNVKYAPCKSVAQLHSAADYILGKKKEQLSSSVIKTKSELYNAFGCNRDNFANSVLMTRKMHQKKYSRFFPRDILAQKLSISFHPEDNDKLTFPEELTSKVLCHLVSLCISQLIIVLRMKGY